MLDFGFWMLVEDALRAAIFANIQHLTSNIRF